MGINWRYPNDVKRPLKRLPLVLKTNATVNGNERGEEKEEQKKCEFHDMWHTGKPIISFTGLIGIHLWKKNRQLWFQLKRKSHERFLVWSFYSRRKLIKAMSRSLPCHALPSTPKKPETKSINFEVFQLIFREKKLRHLNVYFFPILISFI